MKLFGIPEMTTKAFDLDEIDFIGEGAVFYRSGSDWNALFGLHGRELLDRFEEEVEVKEEDPKTWYPNLGPVPRLFERMIKECAIGANAFAPLWSPYGLLIHIPRSKIEKMLGNVRPLSGDGRVLMASIGPWDGAWALVEGPAGAVLVGMAGSILYARSVLTKKARALYRRAS
jgi:hypothetical protein